MSREEKFNNFPKPHIINLLCDMTDLLNALEAKNAELEAQVASLEYQLCEKISCQCESLKSALAQKSFVYQKLEAKNAELEKERDAYKKVAQE